LVGFGAKANGDNFYSLFQIFHPNSDLSRETVEENFDCREQRLSSGL